MINFIDVSKTYVSKSKSQVKALKKVNFELGASGMTFILGKSGSGKSTLLNLLGGLDKPTEGSIHIDGVDMQSFTQADYESYRNSYVGFVFQEYNLLDDFDVKDNVALALQLSKDTDINAKVVDALKQVELNEEYLTRRVGEMSGGEKQRVAIARAIVKDSKMILADEPTGNLDSETGESIWNILKELSRERLVVVVSHDRESAEKYADRIIEISDGRVVADNGDKETGNLAENTKFVAQKHRLAFLTCLKMGFNSLLKHKAKAIGTILVSVFTVCAMLLTQIMATFVAERSIARYIKKYNEPYVTVAQTYEKEGHGIDRYGNDVMQYPTQNYIEQNSQTLKWSRVDNKQQLLDFGFEFIGEAMELNSQSFYLSQDALKKIYYENGLNPTSSYYSAVIVNGVPQRITKEAWPAERLVGQSVRVKADGMQFNVYTLAGVIKSVNIDLPDFFALEEFEGRNTIYSINLNGGNTEAFTLQIGDTTYSKQYSISLANGFNYNVITSEGIVQTSKGESLTLADDEIVISFGLFSKLYGGNLNEYVSPLYGNLIKIPSIIGQKVPFSVKDYKTGTVIFDGGEYTIKGIEIFRDANEIKCNSSILKSANRVLNRDGIIVKTDSVRNISAFLVNIRTKYIGYVTDVGKISDTMDKEGSVAEYISSTEYIYEYSVIMIVICSILAVVMVLMIVNLISFSIRNRQKEIGILSAIGTSAWDIIKIFLIETLIISIAVFAVGLAGTCGFIAIFNMFYSNAASLVSTLPFFVVDPYAILTLLGVCFVLLPLLALLPAIRIAKLKPIDAIRVL